MDALVTDVEAIELDGLLHAILRRYGYDFRHYTASSLARRVQRAMLAESVGSLSALQERILREPACMQRFITHLSIHVTAMFRDPEFYRALRTHVIPLLRALPFARIWHAGCATGEEVYSLAVVLEEEGLYDRCRIYATDISDELLARARRGIYSLEVIRRATRNHHASGGRSDFSSFYRADHESGIMRESLRRNVVFASHNLVSDTSFNAFHLILCRNVMIYFNRGLRERVLELLHASLPPGGVLGVGARESIAFTERAGLYESVGDPAVRLYRRVR